MHGNHADILYETPLRRGARLAYFAAMLDREIFVVEFPVLTIIERDFLDIPDDGKHGGVTVTFVSKDGEYTVCLVKVYWFVRFKYKITRTVLVGTVFEIAGIFHQGITVAAHNQSRLSIVSLVISVLICVVTFCANS